MSDRRIAVVIGTRPEGIKLAPLILELANPAYSLKPIVCLTGQHRHMLAQILDWFQIHPDINLDLMQANQNLAEFAARALGGLSQLLSELAADAVVVQGDTTTAAMAALAAFYNGVPVAHVEAGLRTRDLYNPFPEEMNRRMTADLTRLHFAPTETAKKALLAESIEADRIFVVGNTVVDALRLTLEKFTAQARPPEAGSFQRVLVTAHRRESFGASFEGICHAIRELADRNPDVRVTYPVHLNPNVRDPVSRLLSEHPRIHLIEPVRYEEFVHLMWDSDLILTDSGGIQEEATVLSKPILVLRSTTERPEAIAAERAALVGTDRDRIVSEAERILRLPKGKRAGLRTDTPFGDGFAARRIAEVLAENV